MTDGLTEDVLLSVRKHFDNPGTFRQWWQSLDNPVVLHELKEDWLAPLWDDDLAVAENKRARAVQLIIEGHRLLAEVIGPRAAYKFHSDLLKEQNPGDGRRRSREHNSRNVFVDYVIEVEAYRRKWEGLDRRGMAAFKAEMAALEEQETGLRRGENLRGSAEETHRTVPEMLWRQVEERKREIERERKAQRHKLAEASERAAETLDY